MFKKFPPENPCGPMLEEINQPKRINQKVAENKSGHPRRINQIIRRSTYRRGMILEVDKGEMGRRFRPDTRGTRIIRDFHGSEG